MERLSKNEITAILALIGISSGGLLSAQVAARAGQINDNSPMFIAEKTAPAGKGKDSACGKGSCGTDAKGTAAAKKAHAGKATGKTTAKETKKSSATKGAATDKTGTDK